MGNADRKVRGPLKIIGGKDAAGFSLLFVSVHHIPALFSFYLTQGANVISEGPGKTAFSSAY